MKKLYKLKLKNDDGTDALIEVRSSYETLAAIEDALDEGIVEILQKFTAGKFRMTEVAKIVHAAAAVNGDTRRDVQEIGQLLFNTGFMDVIKEHLDEFLCSLAIPQMGAVEQGKEKGAESSPGKK